MKYVIFLFMTLGFMNCATNQATRNPPFTISQPSFNYWTGGQPGVSGIRIIMPYTSSEEVVFQKIFFQNREGKIDLYNRKGKTYLIGHIDTGTRKGGSLILDIDPKEEMKNEVPNLVQPPIKLSKNDAALVYVYKGKAYYFKLTNLKETKSDFYP